MAVMKVVIFYRPESEHSRQVEDYARDYKRIHGGRLELVSVNTRDGAATATLYDVMRFPAVMATTDIGEMLQLWQGDNLPLMNEVAAYNQNG